MTPETTTTGSVPSAYLDDGVTVGQLMRWINAEAVNAGRVADLDQLAALTRLGTGMESAHAVYRAAIPANTNEAPKPASVFLELLASVVEAERLVVAGLAPEMPCRKMHENRHRAFREALSMATAYFQQNTGYEPTAPSATEHK